MLLHLRTAIDEALSARPKNRSDFCKKVRPACCTHGFARQDCGLRRQAGRRTVGCVHARSCPACNTHAAILAYSMHTSSCAHAREHHTEPHTCTSAHAQPCILCARKCVAVRALHSSTLCSALCSSVHSIKMLACARHVGVVTAPVCFCICSFLRMSSASTIFGFCFGVLVCTGPG